MRASDDRFSCGVESAYDVLNVVGPFLRRSGARGTGRGLRDLSGEGGLSPTERYNFFFTKSVKHVILF